MSFEVRGNFFYWFLVMFPRETSKKLFMKSYTLHTLKRIGDVFRVY